MWPDYHDHVDTESLPCAKPNAGVFVLVMLTVGRWLVHRALPIIQARWSWPGGVIGFTLVVALACAAFTEAVGIHAIFGAFIAGVAIGDSRHLRGRTRETLYQFITYIFAPVFFASIGLQVNFIESFDLFIVLVVLAVALVSKIGGCYLGAKLAGLGRHESLAIGFGMAARGAMEIILGQLAFQFGVISEETLVAVIIMALVTSMMAGPAIQRVLRRAHHPRLAAVLSERAYLPALRAQEPREAIEELAQRAAALTGLSAAQIVQAVWTRELMMHTGVGQGLAVPHARLPQIKRPLMLIGRSDAGIDFDAPDGTRAHFICLLLTPLQDEAAQLDLLSTVSRAFADPRTRRPLLEARSYTETLAALRMSEESPDSPAPPPPPTF